MRQIKLTKDATLISLCSLNYSSSLALNQSASHQRAFLTPPHRRSRASCTHWLFCEIYPSTYSIFLPSQFSKLTLLKREHLQREWKCLEFPLTEIALTSIIVVICVYYVYERQGWGICLQVCGTPRTRLLWEFMKHAQAADKHVSCCSMDVLFSGMLCTGRSIWPYRHHPLFET